MFRPVEFCLPSKQFIRAVIPTSELILWYRAEGRKKHLRQTPWLSTSKFLRPTRKAGEGVLQAERLRSELGPLTRLCIAIAPLTFGDCVNPNHGT